jgi:cobalt-zinc-cadmium efflux system outer membrane protein
MAALLLFCTMSFAQTGSGASIDDVVRIAFERNQEYLAARERVNESQALLRQAGLRPAPAIEIEAGTGAVFGNTGESEFSAGYFHTLETGGKRSRRVAVAEKAVAVSEAEVKELERRLAFEIRTRFIEAASQELKLASVRDLVPLNQENYRVTVQRVELGDAAPLEQQLLLAEMNQAEVRQTVLRTAGEAALVELKSAAGLGAAEPLQLLADFRIQPREWTLAQLQDSAVRQRSDLQLLALLEEQAAAETELERAEGRPNLTASARYTRSNSRFDQFGFSGTGAIVPLRDSDNIFTAGISIPLFSGRRAQAPIEAAESRQMQQRLRREHLARAIPLEVEAAFRRWSGALQSLQILRTGILEPSQRNLTVIREAYRLGELRLLDVLNEQRRFLDMQLSFVDAQAEAARALAELERAVGGTLP